ncbi:MAG: hypothetical protein HUU20_08250 [Pirellulales bacterium]|nr:hypothetical protein [Pirellulales bacterium]
MVVVFAVAGCHGPINPVNNLPPAQQIMHPGPGVDGPGPGVMVYQPAVPAPPLTSQVAFVGPEGMSVSWDVGMPGAFDSEPLIAPARYNFPQGAIYRLKLTNIPGRPGIELYPTLEVGPAMPRTTAFLAHNAIPVAFTEEDFDQVLSGNFVSKVIYLPDPEYQELALAGVETLVSTRLDPGVDPIVEADRRGSILGIVRLGNKDLEVPGNTMAGGQMVPGGMMAGVPCGGGPGVAPGGVVPVNYVSGVTGPQYGMPISGTPIGLPGPPHVPLGGPAGMQQHVMRNWTHVCVPPPTEHVRIDVKQHPGISYPAPANHACIVEQPAMPGTGVYQQPCADQKQLIISGAGEPCVGQYPAY